MRIRIDGEEQELVEKALIAAQRILKSLASYDARLLPACEVLDDTLAKSLNPPTKPKQRFHVRDERTLSKGVADWTTSSQYGNRAVDTGSSGPNYRYKVPIPQSAAPEDVGKMRSSMEALVEDLHESPRPARSREDYYFRDGKAFPVYGARDYHLAAQAFWDEDFVDLRLVALANERVQQRAENEQIDPWRFPETSEES